MALRHLAVAAGDREMTNYFSKQYLNLSSNGFGISLAIAFLSSVQSISTRVAAQDIYDRVESNDGVSPSISRDEWRERIAEARRRAQEFVRERRLHPTLNLPSVADQARRASERVLRDESLRRGDIVSTDKGLFVFKGQADHEHSNDDFIALPQR